MDDNEVLDDKLAQKLDVFTKYKGNILSRLLPLSGLFIACFIFFIYKMVDCLTKPSLTSLDLVYWLLGFPASILVGAFTRAYFLDYVRKGITVKRDVILKHYTQRINVRGESVTYYIVFEQAGKIPVGEGFYKAYPPNTPVYIVRGTYSNTLYDMEAVAKFKQLHKIKPNTHDK